MLLPNDINPNESVYYNGSIILEQLNKTNGIGIIELYKMVKSINNMSLSLFLFFR
ncbi:ABC-three component system middle component 6 [Paenibacillus rhizoplanae]